MGRKCRVEGCLSDSRRPEDLGVTFHKVPFHADIRPKWLSLCRIPSENQANKIIYVCSRHFRRNDFCTFKGTKYMLKQGVLPSMFPWTNEIARQAPKLEPATKPNTDESETKRSEDSSEPPVLSEIESDSQEKTSDETSKESTDTTTRRSKKRSVDTKETTKIIETPKTSENRTMDEDIKKLEEAYFSDSKDSSSQDEYIPLSDFTQGSRVEVTDFSGSWFPAKIIEIDYTENEVFIEFEDSTKTNEWIPMDSKRLRQYADIEKLVQFEVAERVMAMWKNSIKFPATIQKVLANDTYEVLFDDNISLVLKASKISKANQSLKKMTPVTPKSHPSPLFAPVEGSKQDRRDRKRKLNVAELFNKKRPKSDTHSPSSTDKLTKDGGTSGSDGEKDVDTKDNKNSDSVKNETANTSISNESGIISPTSGEWICRWLNGEPVGKRSLVDTRRSVIVDDPKIPPGWVKHFVCRAQGSSAGKWDTVFISPEGKKFRSKSDLQAYLEKEKSPYTLENFDFSLHLKKARSLGLYEINENIKKPVLKNPVILPAKPKTTPKTETVKETKSSTPTEKDNTVADEASNSSLKIIFENGAYKCPIEGCAKTFRKENLTQMHVKHYHPEYSKFIGSTPNVADLAYARTVGEPIEDFLPKSRTVQTPLLSPNSEKLKTETPPPKTIRTSIPNKTPLSAIENEKSSEIEKGAEIILTTPARSKEKDSEIVKILNSDTKSAKSQDVFKMESKLVKINNNLLSSPKYEKKNSPVHMAEAKVVLEKRDIPKPSEIKDYKSGPDSKPSGGGIKTLLPVIRTPQDPEKKHTPTPLEPSLTSAIENTKTNTPKTGPGKHFKRRRNNSEQEPYRKRKYTRHHDYDFIPDYHDAGSRSPDYVPYGRKRKTVDFVESPTINEYTAYQQVTTAPPKHIVTDTGEVIKIVTMKQEEIINCTCGFMEEDGLMIQCELCLCWQHAYCNNIEREDQVPEKYICYICQNPLRMRASRKYMHDQDWLKHGVLPTASFHAKDDVVLNARYERLRQSHELSGNLRELSSVMHSLRVKLKIAENKDHPKFYLWSKPWPKLEIDNNVQEILDNQTRIDNKDDDTTLIEDTIKTEIPISPNEIENSLNRLLNPTGEEPPTDQNKPLNFDPQLEEPTNIIKDENPPPQTNSELLNILEGTTEPVPVPPEEPVKSEEQESTNEQPQQLSADAEPKKDLNETEASETEMKTKNWIDGGVMSGEVSDGEMISQALASEALANDLLSSPTGLNLALSQSDIEKIQNSIDNSAAGALVNPCVPEPEAKIEPDICRENLIDNISHYQKLINSRMDSIEEQISKLENEDSDPSLMNTNETMSEQQIDQKMKETFIMMLRDLSKMRKLAALY